MKKVGKTTRPFRYDLNQILYDYTVEVTNRFTRLDPVDRVPEGLWTELCHSVQERVTKTIPKKKNCKKESGHLKRLYKELKKERKSKAREKEKDIPNRIQSSRGQQGEIRPSPIKSAKK